jgi:hypothetical protein
LPAGRDDVDRGAGTGAAFAGGTRPAPRPETSTGADVRAGRADCADGAIVGGRSVDARAAGVTGEGA